MKELILHFLDDLDHNEIYRQVVIPNSDSSEFNILETIRLWKDYSDVKRVWTLFKIIKKDIDVHLLPDGKQIIKYSVYLLELK